MALCDVGYISVVQPNDFILAVHFALPDNKYIASAHLHNQFHAAFSSGTSNLPPDLDLHEHASSSTQSQLPPDWRSSSRHNRSLVSESNSIQSWYGEPLDQYLCATRVRCLLRRFLVQGDAVGFRRSRREARGGCFCERSRQICPSGESDPILI